jgi:hypothetical protein
MKSPAQYRTVLARSIPSGTQSSVRADGNWKDAGITATTSRVSPSSTMDRPTIAGSRSKRVSQTAALRITNRS